MNQVVLAGLLTFSYVAAAGSSMLSNSQATV